MIRASYMPGKSIIWHSYKPAESGTGASVCGSGNTPVLGDPAKTSREVMCEGKIRAIYELRLGNFPDSGARFSEDILSSRVSCFQHSTSKNGAMFMQFRGICRREGGARYSQVWTDDQDWDRAELRSPGKRSVLQTIKFSEWYRRENMSDTSLTIQDRRHMKRLRPGPTFRELVSGTLRWRLPQRGILVRSTEPKVRHEFRKNRHK